MNEILPALDSTEIKELESLERAAIEGTLECDAITQEASGDIRYWIFQPGKRQILQRLFQLARENYLRHFPRREPAIVLMINSINPENCPVGSGDGWHVDSVREQYKLFCYLSDCTRESMGAFCTLSHPLPWVARLAVLVNRAFGGGKRFSSAAIKNLKRLGFRKKAVLLPAGHPFFVKTSQIHRGLPIEEGRRTMLTAYIYDGELPLDVQKKLSYGYPKSTKLSTSA